MSLGIRNNQYEEVEIDNIDKNKEEETLIRMMIQKIEKIYILILILLWKEVLYETGCNSGTQYYYIVFSKHTESKYYARGIRLDLY